MRLSSYFLASIGLASAFAKTYMQEEFKAGWDKRWKQSDWKKNSGEAGEWKWTAGDWYGDAEADKGVMTSPDARFHTLYGAMDSEFTSNKGKDLVLQFQVKNTQYLDCGGGYIKLIPSSVSDKDMEKFNGDTPYSIMFGPDQCGATKKVHVIFNYNGQNHLIKKPIFPEGDRLSHVYTLVLKPDNTYQVLIDNEEKASGSLYDDWDMLPPRKIKDPEATKPEDWDENPVIPDPEAVKPDGWDDIPQEIPAPDAKKPDDWDDEEDGEWSPPTIPNPEYKGEWTPKMISNPNYKGIWEAPEIDNPDFAENNELYVQPSLKWVGFELWQVKSGTIFDNILVTDSIEEAKAFAEATWGKSKEGEKKMLDEHETAERAKMAESGAGGGDFPEGMGDMDMGLGNMGSMMDDGEDLDIPDFSEHDEL